MSLRAGVRAFVSDCTCGYVCASVCRLLTNISLSLSLFFFSIDQNECKEFGSSVCGTWRCENTIGSYRCFVGCQPGLEGELATGCGEFSKLHCT